MPENLHSLYFFAYFDPNLAFFNTAMEISPYILLAAALLPAVILMVFILRRDSKHPEPAWQLVKAFLFGVISVFVSTLFSTPFVSLLPGGYTNATTAVLYSFGAAAIPEEIAKLIMLWLFLRNNKHFDEHLDGVVYAVCVGLGFASLENIMYLTGAGEDWLGTAIARGLLSVPGHFFFAVLMGYYYSLVHFGHDSTRNRIFVLAAPVLAHGIYDALCMTAEVTPAMQAVLTIALLLFCNELRKLGTRHIRELVENDNIYNHFS